MSDLRGTGAIDWFLIEAPGKTINGELVGPLLDLVNKRLIPNHRRADLGQTE